MWFPYDFFLLQLMNQSDIVLTPVSKGPKNITWRKVLAMVLLLAFVIALVVTLILLLQKDGLYKKLSGIRVKIELSKNVESHIDDLFDYYMFIYLHLYISQGYLGLWMKVQFILCFCSLTKAAITLKWNHINWF